MSNESYRRIATVLIDKGRLSKRHQLSQHAPLISKKIKGRLSPWMSSEVKNEMNLRDQLQRKAGKS